MLSQGIEVLPDRYAVAMLVGAIILGRGRRFITDWSPFIGLLISYDFLRGFADDLAGRAEFVLPMQADTAIFGIVPTAFLQQTFFNSSSLQWYDYAATLLYFLHFPIRFVGRRGIVVGLYVLAAWLAVIYLGEHYAIDVILGALYAGVAFVLGPKVLTLIERVRLWNPDWGPIFRRA